MKQNPNEKRADYLVRVIHEFMATTAASSESMHYDEADCDGLCLADDIESEIEFLKKQRDELLAALQNVINATGVIEYGAALHDARAAISKCK